MMRLAKNLLLVYLLLKPFYFFGSGGLQIADIFLVLSFILFIIASKINKKTRKDFIEIVKSNKLFLIFVILAFLINTAYFSIYGEFKFILSTLYFVFNLLAILTFSGFYKDEAFLGKVSKVFKFNLLLQLVIYLTGLGKYYTVDRYMGTFNDPNQLGYYIFISFLFIYIIRILLSKKENNIVYYLIALFLILQCASTGMILGVVLFLMLLIVYRLRGYLHLTYAKLRKIVYIACLTLLVLVPASLLLTSRFTAEDGNKDSAYVKQSQAVVGRVAEKFSKAENEADISLWEDRGYDIIFKYPTYVLYGAGEGGYDRYTQATNNYKNEIHATFPSLLFYYGIIPFIILVRWIYIKIKDSDPRILIAFAALFVESFTLLNQRQSLFWMIIILGGLYSKEVIQKRSYERL